MSEKEINIPGSACASHSHRPCTSLSWPIAVLLFWPITFGGAVLDLWSKWAVFKWLDMDKGQFYTVIEGFLTLIPRENEGAAFSIFQGWRIFLVSISCVALVVMLVIFFMRIIHRKVVLFALGCMTAGIIGNLYDRAFNDGKVRDFIDVLIPVIDYNWPTFNVADSLLCIGVGLLLIANFTSSTDQIPNPQQTKAP